jgi:hypothetical protein
LDPGFIRDETTCKDFEWTRLEMKTSTMTKRHQTTQVVLARSRALRLAPSPERRCLRVTAGRVWLTRSGAGPQGEDVWLAAGDGLPLPAGTEWVAEGWPEAQAELVADALTTAPSAWLADWTKLLSS